MVNHQEKVHNGTDSDNVVSKRDKNVDVLSSDESLSSESGEIKSGGPAVKAV